MSKRKRKTEDETIFKDHTPKRSVSVLAHENKIFDEQEQEKDIELIAIALVEQTKNKEDAKEKNQKNATISDSEQWYYDNSTTQKEALNKSDKKGNTHIKTQTSRAITLKKY